MSNTYEFFLSGSFIVGLVLGIYIHKWKSERDKDKYFVELETWLKEDYIKKDRRHKDFFQVYLEKKFPEFKEWREKKEEERKK